MTRKLLLFALLTIGVSRAQDVTITPANTTQCAGEIQQLSTTPIPPTQTTLFTENFEGGALGNFTATVISGTVNANSQWTNRTSPYTPPTTVWHPSISSGTKFALSNSDYSGANVNTALESGVLNTTGYSSLSLTFRHYYSDFSATADFCYIEASTNGGTSWTTVQTYSTDLGTATNFVTATVDLSAYINQTNFKFRMRYVATWNDGWAIDDVALSGMGGAVSTFEWTPQTGLYTNAEATTPYTGGAVASVYAKPTETITYTASYTGGDGEATITVTNPAAPTAAIDQVFCNAATVANLDADGDNNWYADETGGTALTNETALVNNGVYYASQIIDGCEGTARSAVTVVIFTPAPPMVEEETQSFCNSATVADLEAEGAGTIQWYAEAEGGDALTGETALVDGTIYYASQTFDTCESILRTVVTAEINVVATPGGEENQHFIVANASEATIEDLVTDAEGTVLWYASEEDIEQGNALPEGTVLVSGNTYYAVQADGDCTSTGSFAVTATVDIELGTEGFNNSAFSYYPNPVKDVLTLNYSSEISSVTIYNMLGQQVMTNQLNAKEGKIDMASLPNGIYIINISAGEQAKTIKVVKK